MFKDEALVLDKWFALQAGAPEHERQACSRGVKQLLDAPGLQRSATRTARAA